MKQVKTNEMPWCPKLRGGTDGMWFPAIAQIKVDGEYNLIQFKNGQINTLNKYGLKRFDFPALNKICDQLTLDHCGEITLIAELYWGEGKNGDLYNMLSNKKSDELKLYVHDIVIQHTTTVERMKLLSDMGFHPKFVLIENEEQAKLYFKNVSESGYEGIVIKPCKATLAMANRWVKMKSSDDTEMRIIDLCEGQERVELEYQGADGETYNVGAKCPDYIKKKLQSGQMVTIRHFGFLSGGGVRNPIIITDEEKE